MIFLADLTLISSSENSREIMLDVLTSDLRVIWNSFYPCLFSNYIYQQTIRKLITDEAVVNKCFLFLEYLEQFTAKKLAAAKLCQIDE